MEGYHWIMATLTLFPDPTCLHLRLLDASETTIRAVVATTAREAACPVCRRPSDRIHSRYVRLIADLSWMGCAVRLELHTRRFFCSNPECARQIFTERLPGVVEPYARRTTRLADIFVLLGFALGGEAGKRLAAGMGLATSPDTLLRLLRAAPEDQHPTPRVLVGTYQLLEFRNLNAQLSRRSIDIHFPRYQATNRKDVHSFKNVLLALQRHLPLEEMPDLVSQWQTCYAYTAGCIGLLKEWLMKALAEAVEEGEKTISPALLVQHAPSPARCDQMITEIEEGEGHFQHDDDAEDRLRSRLGLKQRQKSESAPTEKKDDESQKSRQTSGHAIGQRLPNRDPLKGGAETDE